MNAPAVVRRHRTSVSVILLMIGINAVIGVSVGLEKYLRGLVDVLSFVRDQAEGLLFLLALACGLGWILRLHFSDDDEYRNFKLQRLLCNADGTPNPRNCSLWLATMSGLYFCFYLIGHKVEYFTGFATWFLGILFAYAGATEIFAKKTETPPKGD